MLVRDMLQSQWPKARSAPTFVPESKKKMSRKVPDMGQIPHSTGAGEAGDQRRRVSRVLQTTTENLHEER